MNFAFVFEPAEKDVMKRRPVTSASNKILDPNLTKMILIIGIITGLLLGLLYFILLKLELPIKEVRTLMFVTLSLDSIFFTLSLKDFTKPIWKIDLLSNKYLIFSLMGSISLLLMAVFFLPLQTLLSLTTLNGMEMLFLLGVGIFNLFLIEITKYFLYPKLSVGHGPKFSNKQTPKSPNVRPKGFRVVRRGDLLKLNHQSKLI
jgi:Ca2+-transporting ATPase